MLSPDLVFDHRVVLTLRFTVTYNGLEHILNDASVVLTLRFTVTYNRCVVITLNIV
jgi:hypothetical protein